MYFVDEDKGNVHQNRFQSKEGKNTAGKLSFLLRSKIGLIPAIVWTSTGPSVVQTAAICLPKHKVACRNQIEKQRRKEPPSGQFFSSLAPPVWLEQTTLRLTAACSTDWAKEEYTKRTVFSPFPFCVGTVLSSQAVSSQVFSTLVSLTSVFGMGTGVSSLPLAPTIP